MIILKEDFYGRETLIVAKELLGKYLIHNIDGKLVGGKIVETEGYLGVTDKAAHVYGGKKTPRVMPMYKKPGNAYIYSIYGMYYCLNAITVKEGEPEGVLIRAIEPLIGLDYISEKRCNKKYIELNKKERLNLTSGPSKLCLALNLNKNLIENKEEKTGKIIEAKRIGIDYAEEAKDYLYRFYYEDNPYVSKK